MFSLRRWPAVLAGMLLVGACAPSVHVPSTYPEPEPLESEIGFTWVWSAAIDVATQYHLPIQTLARESGYLSTDRVLLPEPAPETWWDCGARPAKSTSRVPEWYNPFDSLPQAKTFSPSMVSGIMAIAIVPRGTSGGTRVRVTVSALRYEGFGENRLVLCTSRGTFEQGFAHTIVERAAELKADTN